MGTAGAMVGGAALGAGGVLAYQNRDQIGDWWNGDEGGEDEQIEPGEQGEDELNEAEEGEFELDEGAEEGEAE